MIKNKTTLFTKLHKKLLAVLPFVYGVVFFWRYKMDKYFEMTDKELQSENIKKIVCCKWIYFCKNDGYFHKGNMQGRAGFATFLGKVLKSDLEV